MDFSKALDVACLCDERRALIERINDFGATVSKCGPDAEKRKCVTTISVPVSWLPAIIKMAEARLEEIENEIDKL